MVPFSHKTFPCALINARRSFFDFLEKAEAEREGEAAEEGTGTETEEEPEY